MSIAYVDTSALVAVAFDEPRGRETSERLDDYSRLLSSNLLEAELRAAFAREQQEFDADVVSRIDWILPDRPLTAELTRALDGGCLRGADLWHVAAALYLTPKPEEISFITLDDRQRKVASALGFQAGTGWSGDSGPSREESSGLEVTPDQCS